MTEIAIIAAKFVAKVDTEGQAETLFAAECLAFRRNFAKHHLIYNCHIVLANNREHEIFESLPESKIMPVSSWLYRATGENMRHAI